MMTRWPFNSIVMRAAVPVLLLFLVTALLGPSCGTSSPSIQNLGPGKTLYIVFEMYARHGAKAEVIRASSDTLPEFHTTHVWETFDEDGILSGMRTLVIDQEGDEVQEIRLQEGEMVTVNLKTGEEIFHRSIATERVVTVEDVLENSDALIARMQERGDDVVGSGTLLGMPTVVLERSEQWYGSSGADNSTSFAIPWTNDLNPVERVHTFEVARDTPLVHDERTWVVDREGVKTLVESRTVVRFEIQDRL